MARSFQKLTRPAIRAMKAGERLTEHGITVERLADGDHRYSVNIMECGERIHRVVGRASNGITRQQAEDKITNFRAKAKEGVLDLPKGRKTHRAFSEAAELYLEQIADHPRHGRNHKRKAAHIRQRLIPAFKSKRPDQISDIDLARYVRDRKAEGAEVATINRELSTLSHFFGRAQEWGWMKTRPKIEKGKENPKRIVVLDDKQKAALHDGAVADQDPLTWLFVDIATGTAMRHSEILRIRWEELNYDQRRIHIPQAKAGHREQPMPSGLAQRLKDEWQQLGEPTGWIFPTSTANAKHPHRTTMATQFRRAVVRAGLDPKEVTPHVLRHTGITQLVEAGVDLPTVQRVSGHKTLAMVLKYTHLSSDHVDRAVDVLDSPFAGTITPDLHVGSKVAPIRQDKKAG